MDKKKLLAYEESSAHALNWLKSQLNENGNYGSSITDLACYYKSPYLFYLSGEIVRANRILNYLKENFLQENGDFHLDNALKSENPALSEYWSYTNGWITLAAQKMGRFDISYSGYSYLQSFYCPQLGGFKTHQPQSNSDVVDILTTAHLGLTSLYFGALEKAQASGNLLQKILSLQPHLDNGFYLRINQLEELELEFSDEAKIFYFVSAREPNQAYFMIGYPIAFLGKLYLATGNDRYLETAKHYLDFATQCHDSIRSFYFSHKVAWGASIIANLTKEQNYINFCTDIADYLVSLQDSQGLWLQEQPPSTFFDQTAEIAIWLKEISSELNS